MGLFKKIFNKQKPIYEPRTFAGTPGGFKTRRSPSDVLTVSHPSPADYQSHLDHIEYQNRRKLAFSILSEQSGADEYVSEDLFEDQSNGSSQSFTTYSSNGEEEEEVPVKCRHLPVVSRQTAQEQWERLQRNSFYNQAGTTPEVAQPVPRFWQRRAPTAPAPIRRQVPSHQSAPRQVPTVQKGPIYQERLCQSQRFLVHRERIQRVSFLPTRQKQHRVSDPVQYGAPSHSTQRHHRYPDLRQQSPAHLAARVAWGSPRSYHEVETARIRQNAGLPQFTRRMIGGLPVPVSPHNRVDHPVRRQRRCYTVPGAWVD